MRLYSTHFPIADPAHPERPPMLVPEGLSWWGLVFGWLVLLRRGSWLVATLAVLATVLIKLLASYLPAGWVLLPALHLTVALFANDWRRWELGQAGYMAGPVVAGTGMDAAMLRLLDRQPGLLAPASAPASTTGAS